ncbi:MAG: SgcJ/EcaC family oxidoreductase [Candidatus Neomarinimicrobiota bacterium]
MRKSNWILSTIILAITLAMLIFAISCQKQDTEVDIAAIKETLNKLGVAYNTGDFDSWISLWADDGVQMIQDTPARRGKAQIHEAMKPLFDQLIVDINITSIEDVEVHGDLGLIHCNLTFAVTPKAGGETINVMPDGKALVLFERQTDGSWKIVYDCPNSNTPPIVE